MKKKNNNRKKNIILLVVTILIFIILFILAFFQNDHTANNTSRYQDSENNQVNRNDNPDNNVVEKVKDKTDNNKIDNEKNINNKVEVNKNVNNKQNNKTISNNEFVDDIIEEQKNNKELSIGIEKYLEFLWMVDGAFNYQRYDKKEFVVNGKKLEGKKNFSCDYRDNDNTMCYGNNFEKSFKNLFADNIDINNVYSDGVAIFWYQKINDEYTFTNFNNCETDRMSINQKIVLEEKNDNELKYKVFYSEENETGPYKGTHDFNKEFVLVKQDNTWKVSKAYYRNPCYMEYYIS